MIQPVESLEITVLVDNGTDSLSTNPGFVETDYAAALMNDARRPPRSVRCFRGGSQSSQCCKHRCRDVNTFVCYSLNIQESKERHARPNGRRTRPGDFPGHWVADFNGDGLPDIAVTQVQDGHAVGVNQTGRH
jgi:hypothetical protein